MKNFNLCMAALLVTLASCKNGKRNGQVKETILTFYDSVQVNDSVRADYSSRILLFPEIKNSALNDSIYSEFKFKEHTKEGVDDFVKSDSQSFFDGAEVAFKDSSRRMNIFFTNKMKKVYEENGFLAIQYFWSSFGGGAHPNYTYIDKVFDLKKQKKVNLSDITKLDEEVLSGVIMANVRNTKQAEESGMHASDFLLVEKIPVTANFYFDNDFLYFHYGPYEIAPYAYGDLLIPVPWREIEESLIPEFRQRMGLGGTRL